MSRPASVLPSTAKGAVLVLNSGSSSIKAAIFDGADPQRFWSGAVERIGLPDGRVWSSLRDGSATREVRAIGDHDVALSLLLESATRQIPTDGLAAVGHRVVHGAAEFSTPLLVDEAADTRLRRLIPLAPLHMPQNLKGIAAARSAWPNLPQIACFDTMFHAGLPRNAALLALPRRYFDAGVRRYGFHGLSYEYVLETLARSGVNLSRERIVAAHLGAGASMCALKGGRSVETTMGFSTLSGLPMGSRCGDIDPGVLLYLLSEDGLSLEQLQHTLYEESGLVGLSGESADMRDLLARQGDRAAEEAIDFFCYQARRQIGGLAAVLGGLDRLVFTGGIGAHASAVRARICSDLDHLGVRLCERRNLAGERLISADESRVPVEAMETDEEQMIARHVRHTLAEGAVPGP
ncbi:MAG: acetate/propionate family kinase [Hyphomonadaceae bacterium]|nr:acetate/propionate family kinase [Hyphomonadaceae bacterium]